MESFILERIGHDKHVAAQNRMTAKGDATLGFLCIETRAGLEPLAAAIDQRNQADRYVEQGASDMDEVIEYRVWGGIQ